MTAIGTKMAAVPSIDLYSALALAGLLFPIGFVFVIVGRSELFGENFLVPVVAVFKRVRSPWSSVELWGLLWLGGPIHRGYLAYTSTTRMWPWWTYLFRRCWAAA
jgi:formate/nitrite transporter FocA (FNT family)